MLTDLPPSASPRVVPVSDALARAFAQPAGQNLPPDFLALLARIDRDRRDTAR